MLNTQVRSQAPDGYAPDAAEVKGAEETVMHKGEGARWTEMLVLGLRSMDSALPLNPPVQL
jgi:hypothetical protein